MSTQTCRQCGKTFEGRADAAYCSNSCKQRAYRIRNAPPVTDMQPATLARELNRLATQFATWRSRVDDEDRTMAQSDEELLQWLWEDFGIERLPEMLREAARVVGTEQKS